MTDNAIRRVLNDIEKRELPLLMWGVTNGTLSETELEQIVRGIAPEHDIEELIDALIDQGLLVPTGLAEERYRSRMAETVRLATSLRQWFHGRDWTTAPELVSDARFLSRPRVVPRRDCSTVDLSNAVRGVLQSDWTDQHEQAMRAVLAGRSVSAFQARAMARLVRSYTGPRGTVVTAGTGAGKTLAFYLPVLTHLLASDRPSGTSRVVAIYPRNELLRDQLRTLLLTCNAIADAGVVAPTVGVLYGAVPQNRRVAESDARLGWPRQGNGLRCPIVTCLESSCPGTYVWPDSSGDSEELICDQCGSRLTGDRLRFTRDRLQARPPQILFTTTEMLNRLLGAPAWRRLLVGDGTQGPEYLLLDEIHTYEGTHGAQVANLIRRWRSELTTSPHIVGLSATLSDPVGFFSDLIGMATSNVTVIAPEAPELREVGREYFLALRGDPASQTSLLSTTIQTSMLLRRMLDQAPGQPSRGAFGSRVFVFTDDLDVANRLHTQLEDAEGWRPGGVNRKPNGSLTTLRASSGPDRRAREEAGQVWAFAEHLGTLHRPVRVSRTTSRDAGVDADAEMVVATASLEVGFDDPHVGAVLQHKAPRAAAQFLQRLGRAGRDPAMRPWGVVVLSDYGRDRLAFQSYESLFEPIVRPTKLPLRNRVILKMQATWWLLDYLSRLTSGKQVQRIIAGPWTGHRERQRRIAQQLLDASRDILTESGVERLSWQLRRSMSMEEDELQAVLWDHPRGLITAVLPTLVRRLQAVASVDPPTDIQWSDPLREFVPTALFKPLQTPEIRLIRPHRTGDDEVEPVSQAMRQFAPGRVSYRYALGGRRERLWVPPPPPQAASLPVETFCDDSIELASPHRAVRRLVQPTSLRLVVPDGSVSDSSYGRWNWQVAFDHAGCPLTLDVPAATPWASVISQVQALTHRHRCPQTVWRYAETFTVERNSPTEPPLTEHTITLGGAPGAVGFAMDVDAIHVTVQLPPELPKAAPVLRGLRVARMEHVIRTDQTLSSAVPSSFTREWLHQVTLSVLVKRSDGRPLQQVLAALRDDDLRTEIVDAAREVFGAVPIDASTTPSGSPTPGLVATLADAVRIPNVVPALRMAAEALWSDPDDAWLAWIQRRYATSLAAAFVDATQSLCPEVDTSDLRCDIAVGEGEEIGRIRISEDQPGGVGIVETLVDRYVEDPRRFWALVTTSLGPSDGERVDANLRHYLDSASDAAIAGPAARIRNSNDLAELTSAWRDLRTALFQLGLDGDQSIVAALATRLVRPGSDRDLEQFVAGLLKRWDALEASLGIEVELRVFAYVAASDAEVREQLRRVVRGHPTRTGWEIGQIVGLLWPRGYRIRSAALQTYSPYADFLPTERLLFDDIVRARDVVIDAAKDDWRPAVDAELRRRAGATIRASSEESAAMVIRALLTEPTSVGVLEFHSRVVGVRRSPAGLDLSVELREAHQ